MNLPRVYRYITLWLLSSLDKISLTMELSLAFHITGIVLWIGGLMVTSTFLKGVKPMVDPQAPVVAAARKAWFGYLLPGFVIALLSGLHQLGVRGASFYFSQGWFHGKALLLVLLFVATFLLWKEIARASKGEGVHDRPIKLVQGLTGGAFVFIIFLTFLGRGYSV